MQYNLQGQFSYTKAVREVLLGGDGSSHSAMNAVQFRLDDTEIDISGV